MLAFCAFAMLQPLLYIGAFLDAVSHWCIHFPPRGAGSLVVLTLVTVVTILVSHSCGSQHAVESCQNKFTLILRETPNVKIKQ